MNTFYRIRGIFFALFGAYILVTAIYFFGQTIVHGVSSGNWRFMSFGEVSGDPHPHIPPGFTGSVFGALWGAPYFVVAAFIGDGLLWQGRSAVTNPES
jgi:hypothetical protein